MGWAVGNWHELYSDNIFSWCTQVDSPGAPRCTYDPCLRRATSVEFLCLSMNSPFSTPCFQTARGCWFTYYSPALLSISNSDCYAIQAAIAAGRFSCLYLRWRCLRCSVCVRIMLSKALSLGFSICVHGIEPLIGYVLTQSSLLRSLSPVM